MVEATVTGRGCLMKRAYLWVGRLLLQPIESFVTNFTKTNRQIKLFTLVQYVVSVIESSKIPYSQRNILIS